MEGVRAHALDDDDDIQGDDIDREVDEAPFRDSSHAQPPLVPNNSTSSARPPSEANNPFIDAYMVSIKPAREIICGQWSECTWDEKNLNIDAPATIDEVGFMLLTLMHLILMIVMLLLLNLLLMMTNNTYAKQLRRTNTIQTLGHTQTLRLTSENKAKFTRTMYLRMA